MAEWGKSPTPGKCFKNWDAPQGLGREPPMQVPLKEKGVTSRWPCIKPVPDTVAGDASQGYLRG